MQSTNYTGIAIALAWPKTYCKQPGSWYDPFCSALKISKNNYYQVGHAALVLIDFKDGSCHYFDFGRYHSPFQYGRVRSAQTDPELSIPIKAKFDSDKTKILNYPALLEAINLNKACHGDGPLYTGDCLINFEKALNKAQQLQHQSPIPYGPFIWSGNNCSRFVRMVILAGKPPIKESLFLRFFHPVTATPMSNVQALNNQQIQAVSEPVSHPNTKLNKEQLKATLEVPKLPKAIPSEAQWIAGEGAGSWFLINVLDKNKIIAQRFSPNGDLEFEGIFQTEAALDPASKYKVSYLSHAAQLTLLIEEEELILRRLEFVDPI